MIRSVHALLLILAFVPWAMGVLAFGLALLMVVAADKVWSSANWGNCWAFASLQWFKHGGYLCLRPADGVIVSGSWRLPHALWMPVIGQDSEVQQTQPLHRGTSRWLPWFTIYFPYRVTRKEQPHNSNWSDL